MIPLLLLLAIISTIVAGCQLIVASFLRSLQAPANAAATTYFCCCDLCCLLHHCYLCCSLHHSVWRPLAVGATCCSYCNPCQCILLPCLLCCCSCTVLPMWQSVLSCFPLFLLTVPQDTLLLLSSQSPPVDCFLYLAIVVDVLLLQSLCSCRCNDYHVPLATCLLCHWKLLLLIVAF